jgi:hypothetical protein
MYAITLHAQISEYGTGELSEVLVVVTRNEDDLGAVFGFSQDRPDDVVVLLRPVKCASQTPKIDDVTDQVELVGLDLAQEVQQRGCIASACPEMDVGDEDAAYPTLESARGTQGASTRGCDCRNDSMGT